MGQIKSWGNYDYKLHPGEVNDKPSKTQPNMTMGLREILSRFAKGQAVPVLESQFEGDDTTAFDEFPTMGIEKLAPPELAGMRMALADQIGELEQVVDKIKTRKNAKAKAELKEQSSPKQKTDGQEK